MNQDLFKIIAKGFCLHLVLLAFIFIISCIESPTPEIEPVPIVELVSLSSEPQDAAEPAAAEEPIPEKTPEIEPVEPEVPEPVVEPEPIVQPDPVVKPKAKPEKKPEPPKEKPPKKTEPVKEPKAKVVPKDTLPKLPDLPLLPDPAMAMPQKKLPNAPPIGKPADPRLNVYRNIVNSIIQRNWKPSKGRPVAHGTRILMEVVIHKNGSKSGMRMVQGSGDATLDHFAKRTLNIAKFPPFPANYPKANWKVTIGLIYEKK